MGRTRAPLGAIRELEEVLDYLQALAGHDGTVAQCAVSDEVKRQVRPYLDTWCIHKLDKTVEYLNGTYE